MTINSYTKKVYFDLYHKQFFLPSQLVKAFCLYAMVWLFFPRDILGEFLGIHLYNIVQIIPFAPLASRAFNYYFFHVERTQDYYITFTNKMTLAAYTTLVCIYILYFLTTMCVSYLIVYLPSKLSSIIIYGLFSYVLTAISQTVLTKHFNNNQPASFVYSSVIITLILFIISCCISLAQYIFDQLPYTTLHLALPLIQFFLATLLLKTAIVTTAVQFKANKFKTNHPS